MANVLGPMFHGSNADIPVGGVIEPRGGYVDGKYSAEPENRMAFATDDYREAGDFGEHIYQVEPMEGDNIEESMPGRYISRKGFKVLEKSNYKNLMYGDEDDPEGQKVPVHIHGKAQ